MQPLPVTETLRVLKRTYLEAHCSLRFRDPWELLVATILSAQCTDVQVNKVTPAFFQKFPDVQGVATARLASIETLVRSTGFYKNKAKAIKGSAQCIVEVYDDKVPDTMEELLTLPGVARKTANVLLGAAFGKVDGIVVDTHVGRIVRRFGWTKAADPKKIEVDLMRLLPRRAWVAFSHRLIQHGRAVCKAPTPVCSQCPLQKKCPRIEVGKWK